MKKLLLSFAMLVASVGLSQAEWHESGALTGDIGGVHHELQSYWTQVADDVADSIEDEAVRDFAARYAGTVQHTATYRYAEGMEMAGIVLMPPTVWVNIGLRTAADQSVPGRLDIEFALEPETLALVEDSAVIRFYEDDWNLKSYYGFTEGELLIEQIVDNGDDTWTMTGRIIGTLTHQTSVTMNHNPDDSRGIDVSFVIETLARR